MLNTKVLNTAILETLPIKGALTIAKGEVNKSEHTFQLGAVVWKGRRILSSGHNNVRGSWKITDEYKDWPDSYCAEKDALLKLSKAETKGAQILVIRVSNSGSLSKSYPCKGCLKMLKDYGIRKIWYVNDIGNIVWEKI